MKLRAEKERLEEDKKLAWEKLTGIVQTEKYTKECLDLIAYRKKYVTEEQRSTVNLDNHISYLNLMREDKSLYPHRNVMLGAWLIWQLQKNHRDDKVEAVQAVINKGLNSYAPSGFLSPDAPVIEPQYFIWVIQKSNGKIIDHRYGNHREDQNLGLHDLVSHPSMHRITTSWRVNVNGCNISAPVDAGFCPFCSYHAACYRTLNNHIWIHLGLSMFCGVRDCFFATSDSKAMIAHAISKHSDVYRKSKELTPKTKKPDSK